MDLVLLARIMCTLEGLLGVVCNTFLLYSLLRLNSSSTDKVYRVPIYLCGIQGLWLGFWLAVMNYVNIFHDGNFIIPLFGLLVPFLPHWIPVIVEQVGLVFTASLFISIPANSTLQLFALSRQKAHWSPWKRICLAFLLPLLLTIDVAIVVPSFVPSLEFHRIMEETTRELYNVDDDFPLVIFGSTINNTEINYGRSLLVLVIFYVLIPYSLSYAVFTILIVIIRKRLHVRGVVLSKKTMQLQRSFFVMQLLQGFLPLAILSIPVVLFIAGAILQLHLDLFTLLLTYTLWLCPVVQAVVQLRFVRRAAKRGEESTKAMRQSRISGTRQTRVIRTENGRSPTEQVSLAPKQRSSADFSSNGMNFKNGWNGLTLAEFSFNSWNSMDFYDLSVIVGYDTAMRIETNKGGPTVSCWSSGCAEAYLFPTDDTKTHGCPTGGTFTLTFCP